MIQPNKAGHWRWHIGGALLYALCAWVFIDHGVSPVSEVAGYGADPYIFIWNFAWWPWAIAHHANLLHTDLVWQPLGVYLGWITSIPLLSLLATPITLTLGPVASYNLFLTFGPALSAWAAYFLCLKITRNPLASLIGGYLFGFSSYEMAQEITHLNLGFTVFVPLLALVIIKRLNDELSRTRFCALAGVILVGQFLVCLEVFALIFIFGGIIWLFAMLYLEPQRARLRRLFVDGLFTAPLVAVPLSPFFISMLSHIHYLNLPDEWPRYFTIDLFNLVLPGEINWFGGSIFHKLSSHYFVDFEEQDGYLGLPLLLILYWFFRGRVKLPVPRFLLAAFLTLLIASFGPRLWVNGVYTSAGLPWALLVNLPLLSSALPCRFMLFVSLLAAIIAATWIAERSDAGQRNFAVTVGILACLVLVPRPHQWMPVPKSSFFEPGRVQQVLGDDKRLFILPSGINGPSSYWQAENAFGFRQTGGYLGFYPAAMQDYPAVQEFFNIGMDATHLGDLQSYCSVTATQYIVAGPGTPAKLLVALAALNWPTQRIDDVIIFTVPPQKM